MAPERQRPATTQAPAHPAGDLAALATLARTVAPAPAPAKPRAARPLGESVVDVILQHAPALLPHLPQAWLDAKQGQLDVKASNLDVRRRQVGIYEDSRAHYPGLDPMGIGPTREKIDRLDGEYLRAPDDVPSPMLDPALVIDFDDILKPPPFNRAIEMRFRKALHAKLLTQPVRVELSMQHGPLLYWGDDRLDHEQGRVFFRNLTVSGKFNEAYNNDVHRAPEVVALEHAIPELGGLIEEVRFQHEFRLEKDRERPIIAWINRRLGGATTMDAMAVVADAQAHPERGTVEQRLEELSAPCPDLAEWDKPTADLKRAKEIAKAGQFELALWAYGEAERGALRVAQRYERYEEKIQRGGGIAIKWLGRAKIAGTIAAGILTAGKSLAFQAGAAAGYSLLREGAQQTSEIANDVRAEFDVGGLLRQASVEGAMAYLGGVTQIKFTEALHVRFGARLTDLAGPVVAERALSAVAATTSAFYTAPAGRVLNKILAGGELPASLEQLADLIVDEAIQNAALDLGIGALLGKAGAGRPGHPTPDVPAGTTTPRATLPSGGAHTDTGDVHAVLGAPPPATPHVLELAGRIAKGETGPERALLDALGPWEEAMWHLRLGTGPAAGIDRSMGSVLIARLSAHRAALVSEIGAKFEAQPAGKPSAEPESDLDLNVKGPQAGENAVKIKLYLDAKHPGWERRYRMAVMVDAGRTAAVTDALAKLPAAKRAQIAQRRAEVAEALQLMRMARAAQDPAERARILDQIADAPLRAEARMYAALDEKGTRRHHDRLIASTDRKLAHVNPHDPDATRIEDALVTQMKANALDPEAYVSPGAIETIVLGHKLTPQKAYEAVIDQLGMIHHQATAAGGMRNALRRYETFKYIRRICDHLSAVGVQDARMTFLRNHAELVYNVERRATASAEPRDLVRGDLTRTAHTRDVRVDLGETAGVSSAFLADVHRMLDGLLTEHLPALRGRALGEPGAAPIMLPPLGPDVPPSAGPGAAARDEAGLLDPDALGRIGGPAENPPPAGASLQAQADHFFTGIADELTRLGAPPPKIVVEDMGKPDVGGVYRRRTNTLHINSGCKVNGKLHFDGSALGQQHLMTMLLHEARHAEQYFLAARFRYLTQRDPGNLARELSLHQDVLDAVTKADPLKPNTPEHAQAERWYEDFFGARRKDMTFGQDMDRQKHLSEQIELLMTQETDLRVANGRIQWWEIWKRAKKAGIKAELGKVQADLNAYMLELQQRRETYWRLLHEQDARTAERLGAEVVGRRALMAAGKRHAAMRTKLEGLSREASVAEYKAAIDDVRLALDAYAELLQAVGKKLAETQAAATVR